MKRLPRLSSLILAVLLPTAAFAQKEPPHTKETKNAEKFVGLALTRQDAAQRKQYFEQALEPLREAMQKDPDNGRVWLLAGSVFSGLGQFAAADSAFDKAVALHPGYSDQIKQERHIAWEAAFNDAVTLINSQKVDEGIVALETAELMFDERPEAKFYLGLFYMQRNELDKAEQAFNATIAASQGPLRAQLQPAGQADWDRLALSSKIKLSNIVAQHGAEQYDKKEYDAAAASFAKARQMSGASRDHLFNQLQSVYASALETDKQRAESKSAALNTRASELYTSVVSLTDSLRLIDPRNEDIYFFASRAHKVLSETAADQAGKTRHMNALKAINTEYEQVPFLVAEVQIAEADSSATVKGTIFNKLLKPNATGTITFELLGIDGAPIGSAPVNFTVPADAAAAKEPVKIPFEVSIPMQGALAGWRYK